MPVSFASSCHSKSCVNGVCTESTECNSKAGSPNITASGKTLNATDLPLPLTDMPSTTDPISEFVAWIQSILDSIFK